MRVGPLAFDDDQLSRVDSLATGSVDEWLGHLSPEQANAVRARVLDEQPYRIIAQQLQCSELVARQRVSRGLAKLRDLMEPSP
jgi:RNA polymerase sigma-70 factor (ECF subfamily)